MKYGSYLVEGESAPGFYAVCVIHATAEWVRDRNDCLWDGVGMRNHHNGNMFMWPVLICTLPCLGILMHTKAHVLLYAHEYVYTALTLCADRKRPRSQRKRKSLDVNYRTGCLSVSNDLVNWSSL